MLKRMMVVALFLGAPSALANGIGISPGIGVGAYNVHGAQVMHTRAAVRVSGKHLYQMLLFTRNAKMPQPREEGEITI